MKTEIFPPLPLEEWRDSKQTLHLYAQIVGKIRMELTPHQSHWWHVPLYVTSRGLGTRTIPYRNHPFEISFDLLDHKLIVTSSRGNREAFDLYDGLSVSEFYERLFAILKELGIEVRIKATPYDQPIDTSFPEDKDHHRYDKEYVRRFWRILTQLDRLFQVFNRDFRGKICPIQLYWHSFDLAVTRFSGKSAPAMEEAGRVDREAYSHEVISFGFWAGDENIPDAALYSYTFPAPENLDQAPLKPEEAFWTEQRGSPMALLMYEDVRNADDPEQAVLDFLNSAWQAGIDKAGWDTRNIIKQNN